MCRENERVILECIGNLVFAGTYRGIQIVNGIEGILVETDNKSRISIWCPKEGVIKLTNMNELGGE